MMGAKELTSPAPRVMITSCGSAESITESVTSMKFGMYSPWLIASVIKRDVTPDYLRAKVNFKTAQYEYVFRIKLLEFYKGEALTL